MSETIGTKGSATETILDEDTAIRDGVAEIVERLMAAELDPYVHNRLRHLPEEYAWVKCNELAMINTVRSWHTSATTLSRVLKSLYESIDEYDRTWLRIVLFHREVLADMQVVQKTRDRYGNEIVNSDGMLAAVKLSRHTYGIMAPSLEGWEKLTSTFIRLFNEE